ncbi:MAG: MarR family transcriptional regulator [Clostridiales bacterium]|nr:MarR family transcriptional regulator [Clostridiales bacterium]
MNYSDEACIRIDILMQEAMSEFNKTKSRQFAAHGLTSQQVSVLLLLDKHGPLKISTLAENLQMADSNASNICSRLQKMGLVQRQRNKEDMRNVFVSLSNNSSEKIKDVKKAVYEFRHNMSEKLNQEDFETICAGLTKLRELLSLFSAEDQNN